MTGLTTTVSGIRGLYGYRGLSLTSITVDPPRDTDLVGGHPGAVGVPHRVDEVVDQRLDLGDRRAPRR